MKDIKAKQSWFGSQKSCDCFGLILFLFVLYHSKNRDYHSEFDTNWFNIWMIPILNIIQKNMGIFLSSLTTWKH
jgi:hypothetical protein